MENGVKQTNLLYTSQGLCHIQKGFFLEVLSILIQETYGNENSPQPKNDTFRCMHSFALGYYTTTAFIFRDDEKETCCCLEDSTRALHIWLPMTFGTE